MSRVVSPSEWHTATTDRDINSVGAPVMVAGPISTETTLPAALKLAPAVVGQAKPSKGKSPAHQSSAHIINSAMTAYAQPPSTRISQPSFTPNDQRRMRSLNLSSESEDDVPLSEISHTSAGSVLGKRGRAPTSPVKAEKAKENEKRVPIARRMVLFSSFPLIYTLI